MSPTHLTEELNVTRGSVFDPKLRLSGLDWTEASCGGYGIHRQLLNLVGIYENGQHEKMKKTREILNQRQPIFCLGKHTNNRNSMSDTHWKRRWSQARRHASQQSQSNSRHVPRRKDFSTVTPAKTQRFRKAFIIIQQ